MDGAGEKQMETPTTILHELRSEQRGITTILHELRSEQRGINIGGMGGGGITPGHVDMRSNDEETTPVRGRITRRSSDRASEQPLREEL